MALAGAFETLKRFTRPRAPEERCELCAAAIGTEHEHVVDPARRRIVCVCPPCAILFSAESGQRYKRVPKGARMLAGFRMTDANWESLLVPINLAFFFRNSETADRSLAVAAPNAQRFEAGPRPLGSDGPIVAVYPSPGGAIESEVSAETWDRIVEDNPELRQIQPDIEALLVNRLGAQKGFPADQYYLAPIDECYKLVGLVRAHWRGLSGGDELWRVLRSFLSALTPEAVEASRA